MEKLIEDVKDVLKENLKHTTRYKDAWNWCYIYNAIQSCRNDTLFGLNIKEFAKKNEEAIDMYLRREHRYSVSSEDKIERAYTAFISIAQKIRDEVLFELYGEYRAILEKHQKEESERSSRL